MLRIFLERLLLGPTGLETVGIPVVMDGEPRLIFARLTNLLSDGDGHRMALGWKGASGLKPCFKHSNVLKKGSGLAHRRPGYVEIGCSTPSEFRSWSSDQIYEAADLLELSHARWVAGEMPKNLVEDIESAAGLNAIPGGLLAGGPLRSHLDLPDLVTYDWVHTMLQGGVFVIEVQALLQHLSRHGVTRRDVQAFLRDGDWSFRHASRSKQLGLHRVFDQKRVSENDPAKLKCSCSELLGLYGMLRFFYAIRQFASVIPS